MKDRRVLLLACLLPLIGFWAYGLFDLDEGFYGAVVTDMIRRHDWITPTFNGAPWFEKPILSYWLAIPTVMAFGNEFGARLPSVVCTLATCWAWHRFSVKHLPQASVLAPLAYAGSLLVAGVGRMMMTDSALVLCLSLAFFQFYESLNGAPRWPVGLWLGLAVLAKGPVAVILFGGAVGFMAWRHAAWRRESFSRWGLAAVVAVGVASTWFVPCYLANRELFVQEFLIKQNIGRFTGGDTAHATPLWAAPLYFPLVLLLALQPLASSGLGRMVRGVKKVWLDEGDPVETFLWAWAGWTLVFFSISGTKLPHYILPAVGPFVALLAKGFGDHARKYEGVAAAWCAAVGACAVVTFSAIDRAQFADVRRVAQAASQTELPVATYALSGARPKGVSVTLNEQSSPSIGFYLRRPYREFADPTELAESGYTGLVITRAGRINADAIMACALHGREWKRVEPTGLGYELWRLSPATAN